MPHEWKKCADPFPPAEFDNSSSRNDVFFCTKCNQMTFSESGKEPDETLYGLVKDCDLTVVKTVMQS